jgi:hypothetical protein
MARAAKMMDVEVAGRMAKMKVVVRQPATDSAMKRTVQVIVEAMHLTGEAEFNTQPRSKYRNALIN